MTKTRRHLRQEGSALLAYLVALAVISLVISYASQAIISMRALQDRSEASSSYNEFEPIIRNNVGTLLFNFQHVLQSKNACGSASTEFSKLASLLDSGVVVRTDVAAAIPSSLMKDPELSQHPVYKDALFRCMKNQTFQSNTSLIGKQSFYFCGLLSSPLRRVGLSQLGRTEKLTSFAEMRVTFWDFARGVPLNCESMDRVGGRGGIVQYTVYFIRQGKGPKGSEHHGLGFGRHSGRFYVPKMP